MTEFGFKEISLKNWLQPDPIYAYFVSISPTGEVASTKGEDLIGVLLQRQLSEAVPQDIRELFEVARGAMIYGYFFYPLWTLGLEQLTRVVEAAVSNKCEISEAPKSRTKDFTNKIDWLENEKAISPIDKEILHNLRKLRNSASHPSSQSIMTPAMAISLLESIAMAINSIYEI